MTTIVAVDDARVELAIYQHILTGLDWPGGIGVVPFENARDALDWMTTNDTDLIVADYDMPGLSGVDMLGEVRSSARHRDTAFVMITGVTAHDVRYRALELGANDFLTKPIDRTEFIARVRNMLTLAESRRKLANRAAWLAEEVARAMADLTKRERETIHRLTRAAEFRDNDTGAHIVRMGHYCAVIARQMEIDDDRCGMLLLAAPMHDVGKVATPDNILLKAGPLNAEEWDVMRRHTLHGYEILQGSDSELLQLAAEIAVAHHEKYDGTGYPYGLAGEAIPMSGRICAISDVFDALTSKRPYKDAWSFEKSIDHIMMSVGTHFDPRVAAAFNTVTPELVALKQRFADPETAN